MRTSNWRDLGCLVVGLALIIYEAVFYDGSPRPQLLLLYTGMVGLPAFLRTDEKHAPKTHEGEEEG